MSAQLAQCYAHTLMLPGAGVIRVYARKMGSITDVAYIRGFSRVLLLKSCVQVEVAVLGLIVPMVCVDVKQYFKKFDPFD